MDHEVVVRQKMTERYLLNELDPQAREEFEEHFFDCQDCALDVRAGDLFIEQSKVVLAEHFEPASAGLHVPVPAYVKPGWTPWMRWLRPALVVPVMAVLLTVVAYQNLVTLPQ
jgi:anti-sigma factor RsiW